jgi:hypothetical protein
MAKTIHAQNPKVIMPDHVSVPAMSSVNPTTNVPLLIQLDLARYIVRNRPKLRLMEKNPIEKAEGEMEELEKQCRDWLMDPTPEAHDAIDLLPKLVSFVESREKAARLAGLEEAAKVADRASMLSRQDIAIDCYDYVAKEIRALGLQSTVSRAVEIRAQREASVAPPSNDHLMSVDWRAGYALGKREYHKGFTEGARHEESRLQQASVSSK